MMGAFQWVGILTIFIIMVGIAIYKSKGKW